MIIQLLIAITGISAVYLSQQSNDNLKRYACFFGLSAQPLWFYTAYTNEQWGIFVLCFFYTYAWFIGFKNNWIN